MGGLSKLTGRPLPASAKVSNMLGWLVGGSSDPAPPLPASQHETQARILESEIDAFTPVENIGEEVDTVVEGSSLSQAFLPPPAAFTSLPQPQPRTISLDPETTDQSTSTTAAAPTKPFGKLRPHKKYTSPLARHIHPPPQPTHSVKLPFIPPFDVPFPKVSRDFVFRPHFPPSPRISFSLPNFFPSPPRQKRFRPSYVDESPARRPAIPTNNVLYYMDAPDLSQEDQIQPISNYLVQNNQGYYDEEDIKREVIHESFNEIEDDHEGVYIRHGASRSTR